MNCRGLTDPANGVVSFSMTTFQSKANYSCNLGYLLEGVGSRTCQADRMWSDTMPVCERELKFVFVDIVIAKINENYLVIKLVYASHIVTIRSNTCVNDYNIFKNLVWFNFILCCTVLVSC